MKLKFRLAVSIAFFVLGNTYQHCLADDGSQYILQLSKSNGSESFYSTSSKHQPVIGHLIKVPSSKRDWRTMYQDGNFLFRKGQFSQAESAYRLALKEADEPECVKLMSILTLIDLARAESRQKKYSDAENHLRQALKTAETEKISGPIVATIFHNLGDVYIQKGKTAEAVKFLNKGLEILTEVGDKRSERYASTLNSLAVASEKLGRRAEAQNYLKRESAIYEGMKPRRAKVD